MVTNITTLLMYSIRQKINAIIHNIFLTLIMRFLIIGGNKGDTMIAIRQMISPKYYLHGDYLYVVMGYGVSVCRKAIGGDWPMYYAYETHWQTIDTWNY